MTTAGTAFVDVRGDFKNFDRDVDKTVKNTRGKFAGLGKTAAAGLTVGLGGAVLVMKSFVSAAARSEASQARMRTQLKASGISFKAHAKQIDDVIQKTSKLSALDDEDLQDAFTNIVRVTGDVNKSLRLTGLAADFARAKHLDVAKAGEIVGKVAGGNIGILSRYGIALDKGATSTEALGALQTKFAGQAEAYGKTTAGAADRLGVAWENLQEAVGSKLTPALATAGNALAGFITDMQDGKGAGGELADALGNVGRTIGDIGQAVGPVAGDVAHLSAAFLSSEAGSVALSAAVGGLAGRFAGLALASVVAQLGGIATATRAAGGAFAALSVAVKSNPIGLLATAVGLLVGAYFGLRRSQRDATTSSRQLTDALNDQRDAARQLADFDLEARQRKLTLKTATLQLEQSERDLLEARKSGDTERVAQAETGLEQARINVKRATVDVNRLEPDRKRLLEDNADAERKATTAARGRIDTLRTQIETLRGARDLAIRLGKSTAEVARFDEEAAAKTRQLNRELRRLPEHVRVKVDVQFGSAAIDRVKNSIDGVLESIKALTAVQNALKSIKAATDIARGKRLGGRVEAFARGGLVPARVSPGELLAFRGRAAIVPGRREPRDSVFTMLPVGTEVFTDHGQQLLASGATRSQALKTQMPHFAKGGVATDRFRFGGVSGRNAPERVIGASTDDRKTGLDLMHRAWGAASTWFGRTGVAPRMPRVVFTTDKMPIVGTAWNKDDRIHKIGSRQVFWPDWVNRIFIGKPAPKSVGNFRQSDMLGMLIHEWTHYFQKTGLSASDAEGGAQLFARRVSPQVYSQIGVPYKNAAFNLDQYPADQSKAKKHGEDWIMRDQFADGMFGLARRHIGFRDGGTIGTIAPQGVLGGSAGAKLMRPVGLRSGGTIRRPFAQPMMTGGVVVHRDTSAAPQIQVRMPRAPAPSRGTVIENQNVNIMTPNGGSPDPTVVGAAVALQLAKAM